MDQWATPQRSTSSHGISKGVTGSMVILGAIHEQTSNSTVIVVYSYWDANGFLLGKLAWIFNCTTISFASAWILPISMGSPGFRNTFWYAKAASIEVKSK